MTEKEITIKKKTEDKGFDKTARLALLPALAVLLIGVSLCAGSLKIPAEDMLDALFHPAPAGQEGSMVSSVIWQIRFPRAVGAFFLGAQLSLSGYLMQTFFRNPIAGPYVLGVSSGSKLAVALFLIFVTGRGRYYGAAGLISAAFAGALISLSLVLALSGVLKSMSRLIVAGIMIGYICSAITDFVETFAKEEDILGIHGWSRGSFSGLNWRSVAVVAALSGAVLIIMAFLAKPMGAYLLGEAYARNLGVNVTFFRTALILLASLLAACVTAYAGPVSFVGIAVPQMIRPYVKTDRQGILIPACFLGGGVFCLVCDLIARCVFAPTELSISTVTALFGAPVVIWSLIKRKR